ncbi:sensor histidine kinase [Roseobacter sp. HKCCA0434]|uniref:sensor histidine kinase n=1 Tax=Roseobacter sp. HKCCA0434 TaxID=3079297 RepID=UPI002905CE40|nr:PAS domain-containing protein [Roseobacter sp. HKCCA0434]
MDDIGIDTRALARMPFAIVLTNPHLDDNPIVYVNNAFEQVTGYSESAAIGRNCRFLQGDRTDAKTVEKLSRAITEREECTVDIVNYTADGTRFLNRLMIAPLYDEQGDLSFFLGVQSRKSDEEQIATDAMEAMQEIQHRVKNHLAMIVGMIRMQAKNSGAEGHFRTLARRVESLQLLYEEMTRSDAGHNAGAISLGAYLGRMTNAIGHLDGRRGVVVNSDMEQVMVPMETAVRIGLIVSEVLTNSMQHAFDGKESGVVDVRCRSLSSGVLRVQIQDDGKGIPEGVEWPNSDSLGGKIVKQLTDGLGATLSVTRNVVGTIVTLDIPAEAREAIE